MALVAPLLAQVSPRLLYSIKVLWREWLTYKSLCPAVDAAFCCACRWVCRSCFSQPCRRLSHVHCGKLRIPALDAAKAACSCNEAEHLHMCVPLADTRPAVCAARWLVWRTRCMQAFEHWRNPHRRSVQHGFRTGSGAT